MKLGIGSGVALGEVVGVILPNSNSNKPGVSVIWVGVRVDISVEVGGIIKGIAVGGIGVGV